MSLVKRKDGPVQPRPTQVGNTFIGTQTDLTQFGYYTVTNTAPNDAPEGQRYVDSGNGAYDEAAFTYMADWVLQDIPPPPPNYGPYTHLQFIRRFTIEERAAFETLLADARAGTGGLDAATRGQVLVMGRSFESAQEVLLNDPETVQFVGAMVAMGILTQARADEILAP